MRKLVFVLVWLATCSATARAVDTIHNPEAPPRVVTWQLREVWHLDNAEDPALPFLGVIHEAAVDRRGHVFLLDRQQRHVLEIGPRGEFLGARRYGDPESDEDSKYAWLLLTSDDKLGVVGYDPAAIMWLDERGPTGLALSAPTDQTLFLAAREGKGNLVVYRVAQRLSEGADGILFFDSITSLRPDGWDRVDYFSRHNEIEFSQSASDEAASWFPSGAWDVAADGSVLVADQRDAYHIAWHEPDGALRRVITRKFTPRKRTDEERSEAARRYGMDTSNTAATPPVIRHFRVLDDGDVVVANCRAQDDLPPGIHERYDVHDAKGRLKYEAQVAAPVDRDHDVLVMLNDGRFLFCPGMRDRIAAFDADGMIDGDVDGIRIALLERRR